MHTTTTTILQQTLQQLSRTIFSHNLTIEQYINKRQHDDDDDNDNIRSLCECIYARVYRSVIVNA